MEASNKPHALVLPLPAQGHINPMLNFSLQLASRGFITFLNTEKAQSLMKPKPSDSDDTVPQIHFLTIPGGYPESPAPGHAGLNMQSITELLQGIASQQGLMEEMVMRSRDTPNPITCIISDSSFPWTQHFATKVGIKRVIFWTNSGMSFASVMEMRSSKFELPTEHAGLEDGDMVTGGVVFKRSRIIAAMSFRKPEQFNHVKAKLDGIEHTACIVLNTFEKLEASSLKASESPTHVHFVGPILPPILNKNVSASASLFREENSCLQWLDKQQQGSVLYISFGSIFSLSHLQLEELAAGIEESKQPFLWVIRDGCDGLPQGFAERTSGHGLVIKWAPQIDVLGHIAVGGFLTHCGWNSAIESIHMGVPMLCYPLFGDQHINSLLIAEKWKLGLEMHKGEGGVVHRDNVSKAVLALMHSQEIQEMAAKMKLASHSALEQGGSSDNALQSFILDVTNMA